jgi:hypothetical protein
MRDLPLYVLFDNPPLTAVAVNALPVTGTVIVGHGRSVGICILPQTRHFTFWSSSRPSDMVGRGQRI